MMNRLQYTHWIHKLVKIQFWYKFRECLSSASGNDEIHEMLLLYCRHWPCWWFWWFHSWENNLNRSKPIRVFRIKWSRFVMTNNIRQTKEYHNMYHLCRRNLNDAYVAASSQPTIKRPRISCVDLKKKVQKAAITYFIIIHPKMQELCGTNWSNEELAQIVLGFQCIQYGSGVNRATIKMP